MCPLWRHNTTREKKWALFTESRHAKVLQFCGNFKKKKNLLKFEISIHMVHSRFPERIQIDAITTSLCWFTAWLISTHDEFVPTNSWSLRMDTNVVGTLNPMQITHHSMVGSAKWRCNEKSRLATLTQMCNRCFACPNGYHATLSNRMNDGKSTNFHSGKPIIIRSDWDNTKAFVRKMLRELKIVYRHTHTHTHNKFCGLPFANRFGTVASLSHALSI